jgi:LysM repeat protein
LGSDDEKHVIKKGDTYWSLAKNSGGKYSVQDLKTWNPGVDWKKLQPGSEIRVSQPEENTVLTIPNAEGLTVKTVKDPDASKYEKFSFMWWIERDKYAAAFRHLDWEVQKAGAPIAEYISSYFAPLAKNIEKTATGIDRDNRKDTLNVAERILSGVEAIGEIFSLGGTAELRAGKVIITAHTKKEIGKKIGEAVLEHHEADLLNYFLGSGPGFEAGEEKYSKAAKPDALYVAPVYVKDLSKQRRP